MSQGSDEEGGFPAINRLPTVRPEMTGGPGMARGLTPNRLIVALLLVMLSGLPQVGISLTGIDYGGERMRSVPLTRSLFLDKVLPQISTLAPPATSDFPPLEIVPSLDPLSTGALRVAFTEQPEPGPWLLNLTTILYRHHSSYV